MIGAAPLWRWRRRQQRERARHLAQGLQRDAGVDGGGVELRVAEQDLDHADIGLPLQQMRGEAVPQRVHGHPLVELGGLGRGMAGPVELALAFRMPMPKKWSKRRQTVFIGTPHAGKPDADNLAKAIMDALNGVAWHDDGQVARLGVAKAWAPAGAVVVEIREVVE